MNIKDIEFYKKNGFLVKKGLISKFDFNNYLTKDLF